VSFGQAEGEPVMIKEYFKKLPRSYLYFGYTTLVDLAVFESDGKNQPVDGSNLAAPGRRLRKACRDDCGKGLCRLVTDTWIRYCGGVQ
jgi:hypothetical protein